MESFINIYFVFTGLIVSLCSSFIFLFLALNVREKSLRILAYVFSGIFLLLEILLLIFFWFLGMGLWDIIIFIFSLITYAGFYSLLKSTLFQKGDEYYYDVQDIIQYVLERGGKIGASYLSPQAKKWVLFWIFPLAAWSTFLVYFITVYNEVSNIRFKENLVLELRLKEEGLELLHNHINVERDLPHFWILSCDWKDPELAKAWHELMNKTKVLKNEFGSWEEIVQSLTNSLRSDAYSSDEVLIFFDKIAKRTKSFKIEKLNRTINKEWKSIDDLTFIKEYSNKDNKDIEGKGYIIIIKNREEF